MNEPSPRFWEIFFEVYENLPRQGPGNRTCAVRALGLCRELREFPEILDLGCGVGGQTLQLAELTSGSILAIDNHPPSIERLQAVIAERGLAQRVRAIVGDMASLKQPLGSFDLIWSEGALYNIGLRYALRVCNGLLRPGGYLAFTDAVWRKENPPPEVKAGFDLDYPAMGWVDDVAAAIQDCGFELVGSNPLQTLRVSCDGRSDSDRQRGSITLQGSARWRGWYTIERRHAFRIPDSSTTWKWLFVTTPRVLSAPKFWKGCSIA